MNSFVRLSADDGGATMVEYGLMLALVAVVSLGAILLLGQNVSSVFTTIANTV